MKGFAPNLTMLFTERPFLERFAAARAAGFRAVEFQLPYGEERGAVRTAAEAAGVAVALFNLPAGRWDQGERGIAILPDRSQEFRDGVELAIEYARELGCTMLNCLAGKRPDGLSEEEAFAVLTGNVVYASERLADQGMQLLVEPCNHLDIPGFFVDSIPLWSRLYEAAGVSNLYLQYDFYHVQRMQGELLATFASLQSRIAHVQIADNPGRHEPGTGEIHYPNVFAALAASGYEGYIGLEYIPSGLTESTFGWIENSPIYGRA